MAGDSKTRRFFAAMLAVGGVVGIVIAVVVAVQLAEQGWALFLAMGLLATLFAWAAFVGVRLWQNAAYGRKWAPILFASQIPVLALPGVGYQWFTGGYFGPVVHLSGGEARLGLGANVGANSQFSIGTGATEFAIGLNLFALAALILLVRSNNSSKPTPLRGAA